MAQGLIIVENFAVTAEMCRPPKCRLPSAPTVSWYKSSSHSSAFKSETSIWYQPVCIWFRGYESALGGPCFLYNLRREVKKPNDAQPDDEMLWPWVRAVVTWLVTSASWVHTPGSRWRTCVCVETLTYRHIRVFVCVETLTYVCVLFV